MIWNPAFVKRIENGYPFPKDVKELNIWVPLEKHEAEEEPVQTVSQPKGE